jgi:hypothetical protein
MITTLGKAQIKSFFGTQEAYIANYIALGVNPAAAQVGDVRLGYEVARVGATARADLANDRVVFKGQVAAGVVGTIYEVGLYAATLGSNAKMVPVRPGPNNAWTGATVGAAQARSTDTAVAIAVAANGTGNAELTGLNFDASGFGAGDFVAVSFFADANLSSFKIRIGQSSTVYREYTVSAPAAGYQTVRLAYPSGVDAGTVNMQALNYIAIRPSAKAAGNTTLYIDGVRIESANDGILIARSVLATPTVLDTSVPTDIEYSLEINV